MTEHREVRYATPSLIRQGTGQWLVRAQPGGQLVGRIDLEVSGWTATTATGAYAGLWPTKQAAAEVLVKQAGYEVGEVTARLFEVANSERVYTDAAIQGLVGQTLRLTGMVGDEGVVSTGVVSRAWSEDGWVHAEIEAPQAGYEVGEL